MKTKILCFVLGVTICSSLTMAQFTKEEIAEFKKWEEFLATAEIVSFRPWEETPAVTDPWVLTLEKDGITKQAMWKNPEGRQKGYLEGWKWEIAAYRLSNHLGIFMVSPTVEKRFRGNRGSCQLFVNAWMDLETKESKKMKVPSHKVFYWNRALYIQRTFDNLIANARSFSPPGGTVRVTCRRTRGEIEIVVDDEGPGIRPDAFERIFERFYTDRPHQGFGQNSGLGLSISKQIIEAHGGRIHAENREGIGPDGDSKVLGARFVIRLPAM